MRKPFDLATKLKALRAKSGLTQEQVAERTGIGYKFYQKLEYGNSTAVRIVTAEKICDAYGIELWEFFYSQLPQLSVKSDVNKNEAEK